MIKKGRHSRPLKYCGHEFLPFCASLVLTHDTVRYCSSATTARRAFGSRVYSANRHCMMGEQLYRVLLGGARSAPNPRSTKSRTLRREIMQITKIETFTYWI